MRSKKYTSKKKHFRSRHLRRISGLKAGLSPKVSNGLFMASLGALTFGARGAALAGTAGYFLGRKGLGPFRGGHCGYTGSRGHTSYRHK